MSYIAFLCVSIFREVFLECLPGVLVELDTIIVSERVEQSTPAHMVSSDVSNTWGINTGGGTSSNILFHVILSESIAQDTGSWSEKGSEKKHLQQLVFSKFGVYTSIFGVENLFTNWYPCWPLWQSSANKFFLPGMWAAWITIPGFTPVKYLPNKATQLKGLRPPPFPIEKIWHHCWVVSTEFMLFSSVLSKWIRANWTTLISNQVPEIWPWGHKT